MGFLEFTEVAAIGSRERAFLMAESMRATSSEQNRRNAATGNKRTKSWIEKFILREPKPKPEFFILEDN